MVKVFDCARVDVSFTVSGIGQFCDRIMWRDGVRLFSTVALVVFGIIFSLIDNSISFTHIERKEP